MYDPASLQPGDILLMQASAREGPLARLLDWAISRSEANPLVHTALVGRGAIYDPLWHITISSLDRYAQNGWAFRVNATPEQKAAAVTWADAHLGQPYGVREILADAARYDLHIVLPSWYRWRPHRWTCSGFVTEAYRQAGVILTDAPAPSPADLSYSPLLVGPRPWEPPTGGSSA